MLITQEAKDHDKISSRLDGVRRTIKNNSLISLVVEPASTCNLACTFCDLHSGRIGGTEKLKGVMELELYQKLIDDLSECAFELTELQLHGNGEPFLNKKLPQFISYASNKRVAQKIRVTTNGTVMTHRNLINVIKAGVTDIHVSLDVSERDEYKRLKGKDLFNKVDKNIDMAIDLLSQHPSCSLFIKCAKPNEQESYGFTLELMNQVIEKYSQKIEHTNNIFIKTMPVVEMLDGLKHKKEEYTSPCEIPFYSLFVRYDGDVTACCADISGKMLNIGNVAHTSFKELLSSTKLSKLRKDHLNGNFKNWPLCLYCANRTSVDLTLIKDELNQFL